MLGKRIHQCCNCNMLCDICAAIIFCYFAKVCLSVDYSCDQLGPRFSYHAHTQICQHKKMNAQLLIYQHFYLINCWRKHDIRPNRKEGHIVILINPRVCLHKIEMYLKYSLIFQHVCNIFITHNHSYNYKKHIIMIYNRCSVIVGNLLFLNLQYHECSIHSVKILYNVSRRTIKMFICEKLQKFITYL
ncbi:hypothetical protein AK88_00321 [Plasmodium fragile]|uniref:Uncharacterized protein n=1 Tax=Plasmodium fragile TaxID=5857 RepID=A0A0D9QTH9_PLAFR|nr:uncharacterized protein AK88_00321 [Plasmodium fragile]KJP90152.1 hypothetical protein AK88_00321 [Plasmodium fragile]